MEINPNKASFSPLQGSAQQTKLTGKAKEGFAEKLGEGKSAGIKSNVSPMDLAKPGRSEVAATMRTAGVDDVELDPTARADQQMKDLEREIDRIRSDPNLTAEQKNAEIENIRLQLANLSDKELTNEQKGTLQILKLNVDMLELESNPNWTPEQKNEALKSIMERMDSLQSDVELTSQQGFTLNLQIMDLEMWQIENNPNMTPEEKNEAIANLMRRLDSLNSTETGGLTPEQQSQAIKTGLKVELLAIDSDPNLSAAEKIEAKDLARMEANERLHNLELKT